MKIVSDLPLKNKLKVIYVSPEEANIVSPGGSTYLVSARRWPQDIKDILHENKAAILIGFISEVQDKNETGQPYRYMFHNVELA